MTLKRSEKKKCQVCHERDAVVIERTRWLIENTPETTHYFCASCKIMEMKRRGYL